MSTIILPYREDISKFGGGYIKPNGEIIYAYGKHQEVAKNYCEGSPSIIENPQSGIVFSYPRFFEFKRSQLTPEQFSLYQLWITSHEEIHDSLVSDFLIRLLEFDKVEYVDQCAITTTSSQPHIRFYNYYLMDWRIDILPKLQFNKDTHKFENDFS